MDGGVSKRIAAACLLGEHTRVVEVGPGTGALTKALLDVGARVTAIEVDDDMVEILRGRADLAEANVVHADALGYDYASLDDGAAWCAAGNLPYNIATPLVTAWLESARPPQRIVVMVQRDVADRLIAKPSTPQFGSLSLYCQYFTSVKRAFVLGPGVFYPRPNVDSAVVVLDRHETPPVTVRDRKFFLQVVRAAFAYRRKTLANSLHIALAIERARTQAALAGLAIDSEIRAEQLDLGAFGTLADALAP